AGSGVEHAATTSTTHAPRSVLKCPPSRQTLRRGATRSRGSTERGPLAALGRTELLLADDGEDRLVRDDEVGLPLELDLDGGAAEEERVVALLRLHGEVARLAARLLPRLILVLAGIAHGDPGAAGDHLAALDRLSIDRGLRQEQSDVRALLALL